MDHGSYVATRCMLSTSSYFDQTSSIRAENEILGELATSESVNVHRNPDVASYRRLGTYASKGCSALTEVRTDACPQTASITAPGGRDLDRFSRFL